MKRKTTLIFLLLILGKYKTIAQDKADTKQIEKIHTKNKGKIYFYWGWNTTNYSNSTIHFSGTNYDFTIHKATASDKITTPIGYKKYINPANMTIPQTNARLGYYFHDNWNASIGLDHMKYVLDQFQTAKVSGEINLTPQDEGSMLFNGIYDNEDTFLWKEFASLEHTDGLNYVHLEIARVDNLGELINLNPNKVQLNITEGFGAGILIPKTNAKVLNKNRHDAFHLAGYGLSLKGGINITFFNSFFIQTEIKGGFINLPDVRTSSDPNDRAKHSFFFLQRNITFGGTIQLF